MIRLTWERFPGTSTRPPIWKSTDGRYVITLRPSHEPRSRPSHWVYYQGALKDPPERPNPHAPRGFTVGRANSLRRAKQYAQEHHARVSRR